MVCAATVSPINNVCAATDVSATPGPVHDKVLKVTYAYSAPVPSTHSAVMRRSYCVLMSNPVMVVYKSVVVPYILQVLLPVSEISIVYDIVSPTILGSQVAIAELCPTDAMRRFSGAEHSGCLLTTMLSNIASIEV